MSQKGKAVKNQQKKKNEKKKNSKKSAAKDVNCCGIKKGIKKVGANIINRFIDTMPFELHVPSYQYCGPGTNLEKRLARGDPGINPLDAACKKHDITYSEHKESSERSKADEMLQKEALKRAFSRNASLGERAVALGVAGAMKLKRKLSGKGLSKEMKKKKQNQYISFQSLIKNAKLAIKDSKPDTIRSAVETAISTTKQIKKGKRVREPRTIKLPSVKGGVLPLVPIFAGLGALGSIIGSSAGIVNAINQTRRGQMELDESKRHNQAMEAIAIGNEEGKGFYLHQNKNGSGYYLAVQPKNH